MVPDMFVNVQTGALDRILLDIVDTAIAIADADFGNVQLFDPGSKSLRIVAQRGFPDYWLRYWKDVAEGKGACGSALSSSVRIIVEDVLHSPIFSDPEARDVMLRAGIRSVQSTPLVSRSGEILGMFSTHRTMPWYPSPQVLRTLDLLSRLAADAIELARLKAAG